MERAQRAAGEQPTMRIAKNDERTRRRGADGRHKDTGKLRLHTIVYEGTRRLSFVK